jgi:hypothetical protein
LGGDSCALHGDRWKHSPYDGYIPEENRPYQDNTLLEFRLADGVEIPDTTEEAGGAAGGVNPRGQVLPPIVFPKPAIDTTGGGKAHGALKGAFALPGDGSSESETDSAEALEDEDTHKLRHLSYAVRMNQPIAVTFRGQYQFAGRTEEVMFHREFTVSSAAEQILDPVQVALKSIGILGAYCQGTDLPRSCTWTTREVPRSDIEISAVKQGRGVHVIY